jgi:CRISPR system Cascade subunit CasE
MNEGVWFTRLTLKREDAAVAPLLKSLAPAERGAAMSVAHRLMWSAAAPQTQGAFDHANPERSGRAAFLWREIEPGHKFYMLGPRPADTSPFFHIESKYFAPDFRPGDRFAFELRINATVARRAEDGGRSKRADVAMDRLRAEEAAGAERAARPERREAAAQAAVTDWLGQVGARDGFALRGLRLEAYRVETLPRRGRSARIGVSDVRGVLEVGDGERFLARVIAGFGRAKAFGCGLMLLRRT